MVFVVHYSRIAEIAPGQRDRRGVRKGFDQCGQGAVAHMHSDEFVDVEGHQPFCPLHRVRLAGQFQSAELDAPFAKGRRVADVGQPPQRLQPVQHKVGAIVAVVRHDNEIRDADAAVPGQPIQQKRRLVADTQNGGDGHGEQGPWLRKINRLTVSGRAEGVNSGPSRATLALLTPGAPAGQQDL